MKDEKRYFKTFFESLIKEYDYLSDGNQERYGVSFSHEEAQVERFSRVLWKICWDSHCDKKQVAEVRNYIVEHCNPNSSKFWGKIGDYSQTAVEMVPIALLLFKKKEDTWLTYSEEERSMVAEWLLQINTIKIPENNWLFFRILVNLFLYKLNILENPSKTLDYEFRKIEKFYLGKGWYSDGVTKQRDYYVAFAFHYYSLIYAVYAYDFDSDRCRIFKERANEFSKEFINWFSPRGDFVPFGRSLIYRFAPVSFWAALIWSGANTAFSTEDIKGIILRNIAWWEEQPIMLNGVLSLGYTYPNPFITEEYNSEYSPYWCLKSAILLDIPDKHDFWKLKDQDLPRLKPIIIQNQAGCIVSRFMDSVNLFPTDQRCINKFINVSAKYEKYVYSNISGFSVMRDSKKLEGCGADSTTVVSCDNENYIVRSGFDFIKIKDAVINTTWYPYGKHQKVKIETQIVPGNPYHVRIHQVYTDRVLYLYDNGFSFETETGDWVPKADAFLRDARINNVEALPNSNILYNKTHFHSIQDIIYPGKHTLVNIFALNSRECETEEPQITMRGRKIQVVVGGQKYIIPLRFRYSPWREHLYRIIGKLRIKMTSKGI